MVVKNFYKFFKNKSFFKNKIIKNLFEETKKLNLMSVDFLLNC